MKFKYKKYGRILRPVIPIEISGSNLSIKYEVLVDSGSDMCIFPSEIGEIVGLDITSGILQEVRGITGNPEKYYLHKIDIKVGGWEYKIQAGFLPSMSKDTYGVVGQTGFFEYFVIKFDLAKEEIEIKSKLSN